MAVNQLPTRMQQTAIETLGSALSPVLCCAGLDGHLGRPLHDPAARRYTEPPEKPHRHSPGPQVAHRAALVELTVEDLNACVPACKGGIHRLQLLTQHY